MSAKDSFKKNLHTTHVRAVGWEPHGSPPTAWMLHVASFCTPCCICVLLAVVAQSFKTVKLLATCKRTQQLPKSCCEFMYDLGATGQRVYPNEEENMATCFHGGQRIR